MSWSEPAKARLQSLWASGLTATEIADDPEVLRLYRAKAGTAPTRNAVIGQVHRMGLLRKSQPKLAQPPRPPEARRDPAPASSAENARSPVTPHGGIVTRLRNRRGPQAAGIVSSIKNKISSAAGEFDRDTEATDLPIDESSFAVTFEALRELDQCRWPIGDPSNLETFRLCGAPQRDAKCPYCRRHAYAAGSGYGGRVNVSEPNLSNRGRKASPFSANPADPFN